MYISALAYRLQKPMRLSGGHTNTRGLFPETNEKIVGSYIYGRRVIKKMAVSTIDFY